MSLAHEMRLISEHARKASYVFSELTPEKKNKILKDAARSLEKNTQAISRANQKDVTVARDMKLTEAALDRLTLDAKRIAHMAHAVWEVAQLPDPVGKVLSQWKRPNGLR